MEEGEFHVNNIEIVFNKIKSHVSMSIERDAHSGTKDIHNKKEIGTEKKFFVSYE